VFIKVTRSGPRRYVQLVQAYRDEAGAPRQRPVATLGRLDQLRTELKSVICGLLRVTGKAMPEVSPQASAPPAIAFECARDFGDNYRAPDQADTPTFSWWSRFATSKALRASALSQRWGALMKWEVAQTLCSAA
jgi:hypothetical protein